MQNNKSPTLRERGGLESQAGRDAEQGDAMRGEMQCGAGCRQDWRMDGRI